MNNKGFTLIELLVALAISALILIMAIPSINNMSSDTQDREYQEYKESIVYGAKLYYRQKYDDISGWVTKGNVSTVDIYYSDLVGANYVKDFSPTERGSKKKCDASEVTVTITVTTNTKGSKKVEYKVNGLECGVNKLEPVE